MNSTMTLSPISVNPRSVTHLTGLRPETVDEAYLNRLGVTAHANEETLNGLISGSRFFENRLRSGKIIPRPHLELAEIDLDSEFEIHNYTGACPILTYEINPVLGCNVGCLYCLVTDGVHEQELKAFTNYHELVSRILEKKNGARHYYYFSPKTEAFQEPTLQTGIAHNILRAFVEHFKKNPTSQARLFIASKAGIQQLQVKHENESILDLFIQLKNRMQFNTSVSIMPDHLRDALEPYAASIEERLEAVLACQSHGIMANSALVQPIVAPYLTDENMHAFFAKLAAVNIINYKPEFLTACMENLAMIGQIQGYYDKAMEKEIYDYYISPENSDHKKQRGRTAPNRELSKMYLERMIEISKQYGMTISICHWVRRQLNIPVSTIPMVNKNGFQCLGYQRRLFDQTQQDDLEN